MRKYILIESGEPEDGCRVTICDSSEDRDRATCIAICGVPLEHIEQEVRSTLENDLSELRENGRLEFEGDPGLEWVDANEVVLKQSHNGLNVKPLVWDSNGVAKACFYGWYCVIKAGKKWIFGRVQAGCDRIWLSANTLEAAKAIAQADHEKACREFIERWFE